MEKILLHTCCAPCSASTIPALTLLTDFKIVSLWYNPNIYPRSEYISRYDSWKKYMQIQGIKTIEEETPWNDDSQYEKMWLDDAVKYEKGRCQYCYLKRLEKTAKIAQKKYTTSFEELTAGQPEEFLNYFKHADKLEFEDQPNYVYLIGLFQSVIDKYCSDCLYDFDWKKDSCSYFSRNSNVLS